MVQRCEKEEWELKYIVKVRSFWPYITQWVRKLKKSRQKKVVKSNKSEFFFHEIPFLAIFEIAKNGIWSEKVFVELNYLISRVFLA